MCMYLATKPKKLQATAVLVSFIAANTIHLAIGTRNPFILSILFAFVYYFMREQTEKGKWIGFKEKLAIFVGSPILMLAMEYLIMYGIMSKFPIQVSGISYLTLSINKGLVLVFWLEVFYLTVASLTEISVILLLVLFLIILQGEFGSHFRRKSL